MPPGFRGLILKERIAEAAPVLEVLEDVARQRSKTIAQVAINWCICKVCAQKKMSVTVNKEVFARCVGGWVGGYVCECVCVGGWVSRCCWPGGGARPPWGVTL
jgi:hypothetical protein